MPAGRRISLITRHGDGDLRRIQDLLPHATRIDGRAELERALAALAAEPVMYRGRTLDLIGHSSPAGTLALGGWTVDARDASTAAWLSELAAIDLPRTLGVEAVRLLGCSTAVSEPARVTLLAIAERLGVDAYGTRTPIGAAHFDAGGFSEAYRHLLVSARELRAAPAVPISRAFGPIALRLAELEVSTMVPSERLPRVDVASGDDARRFLSLLRGNQGAPLVGIAAEPCREVLLPADKPDRYHRFTVLSGGRFVAVYTRQHRAAAVVFPVIDPCALVDLLDTLV